MRCPFCGEDNDKVIDSRATEAGRVIRRRRHCLKCNRRFTTKEHIEENARLIVIKKDGARVPFDREKVLGGLQKACYKRPIGVEQLQKVAEEIEDQLSREHEREVESIEIGRTVADRLKRLDQVAYVRFASVYKQFRDLDDFLDEVREVLESSQPNDPPEQGRLF